MRKKLFRVAAVLEVDDYMKPEDVIPVLEEALNRPLRWDLIALGVKEQNDEQH